MVEIICTINYMRNFVRLLPKFIKSNRDFLLLNYGVICCIYDCAIGTKWYYDKRIGTTTSIAIIIVVSIAKH